MTTEKGARRRVVLIVIPRPVRARRSPSASRPTITASRATRPESKIGTCNVCHELAPYSRTPQSRYVFRAVFTHGDHNSVGCGDCHSVRPGRQGNQVTAIVAQQHNNAPNSCATCHNGSRAFSGNDPMNFSSCARCHKGSGFDMLPGS